MVLEPDALGLLKKCLVARPTRRSAWSCSASPSTRSRPSGTRRSTSTPATRAGCRRPRWPSGLKQAGIEEADGFSLNVSNYKATETEIKYGKEISKRLGGKHFVIDTSRNGNGPPVEECKNADGEACWCNPPGRALGTPPTTETADPLVDAYLWLKKPGESDGKCNGGPKAGMFWQERALELARNAKY